MSKEETIRSKWFWWTMGIVATVVAAAIITALHLNSSNGSKNNATPEPPVTTTLPAGLTTTTPAQTTTTPAQATTAPDQASTAQASTADYSGTYNGQALNGGAVGDVQLQVNAIDPSSGATTGHVTWSGALNGEGPLRGAFNANNATFEGEIASQEGPWDVEMYCTFSSSGNVTCNYQLQAVAPNDYAPQQGSLSANE